MYYSVIGLLAIMVLVIVNQDILFGAKNKFDKPAWKIYRRFLFAVLTYYITDVLWGLIESRKSAGLLFADTTVYFVAMSVSILLWAEYTVTYLDEKNSFGRFLIHAGRTIAGLITVLVAVNIFTPMLFSVDEGCVYTALPLRYVVLSAQILLFLLISVYAFLSMFRLQGESGKYVRYRTLAFFGLIMAALLFIQLWFPYLPVYSIGYMLGTCLLHTYVANDEKEDHMRELEETSRITELRDRFAALLDNMPGMAFTKDVATGVYLACNQAFAEYAQKSSPDGVVGLTDMQIFDAETAAHFAEDDKTALSLSKPYIFFEDVLDAAGNRRQLQTTRLKYTDTKGRLCVLGMCQDVTDMVRIQHERAMTQEAYEKAVSSGLMYTNIAQTLARDYIDLYYINADTEEYVEYRRGEKNGTLSEVRRDWHFFSDGRAELAEGVVEDDREAFLKAMHRKTLMKALEMRDTFSMTYRQIEGEGEFYVNMKISRMEDEHYIIIGITDVDAQMRETMAKNEALAQALSSAEEANKTKTTFLSGMSHEIRTPLNAIIGLDTLALKKAGLDDDTRGYLEKIGDSASHLLFIINDILDMSRIESGRALLHGSEFSLSALLEQINSMVGSQCAQKGLEYKFILPEPVNGVYLGDDIRLKEMLMNILSNAVKFTPAPGSVTFAVEKTPGPDGQTALCFRVKDTGIGMDKDYIPKIFDPFSRENNVQKTKSGSSGLGMAITKRIIEMMNGTIDVSSEKGVGTEFTVRLNLRKVGHRDAIRRKKVDTGSMYVLVVDDNPIEAEHAKMVLEEAGIRSDICTGGQEALRKLGAQHGKHDPYNIVLMDWNMPGMSGEETAAEVRKLYEGECTVVAMTAYSWDDIRENAGRVGVENYISKPLFASSVLANLEHIANRSRLDVFGEKERASVAGRRILLAEDVEINAQIMADTLEMENIKVDHAENGMEAVEMFENSTAGIYSAILMDVRMPIMDGLEAAREIRAMKREDAKRIPIIALTANSFDEDVERSMQAGMNAHLSKPVEIEQLIRVLGELIYEAERK